MSKSYSSTDRHKYYLKCHLIFVCKYRKILLEGGMQQIIKDIFLNIEKMSDFVIEVMETDKDHIHMLVSYPPNISVTSIVRRLKQESTREMWKRYPGWLRHHFWKERTFWSDGYFVCSIGEASPETVRRYIENQG
ncbi:MAG: IS200/IS605 family transposase [Bacteroidales bacterium]|nr:IS200/IS605 family transposase [Candidatus Cryptobacteroides faecihippi]MCQ2163221.1 IS200/IS605 family transposase [Bacteroidales bacterium]